MSTKPPQKPQSRRAPASRAASPLHGNAILFIGIAIALGLFAIQARQLWFTQDDAYISYRYARNALDGQGLVFNTGERVEGYTNFLWVIWLVAAGRLGAGFDLAAKVLGILSAAGMIVLAALLCRRAWEAVNHSPGHWAGAAGAILLGGNGSFAYWAISGLETAFFGLWVAAAIWWWVKRSPLVVVALTLGAMTRPEGGLIWIVLVAAEVVIGDGWRRALTLFGVVGALLIPFGVFKILYYGSLLPNPFYAKTGLAWEYFASGLNYAWFFQTQYGLWGVGLLLVVIGALTLPGRWRAVPFLWLVFTFYIVAVGGDVLRPHRFFVPVLVPLAIAIIGGLSGVVRRIPRPDWRPWVAAWVTGALVAAGWFIPKEVLASTRQLEMGLTVKMSLVARNLVANDTGPFSLAVSTIGRVAYELPGHRVIDMLGLTDSTVARHPEQIPGNVSSWKERNFNATYILSQDPDYILFSTGNKPSAPAERALILHSKFRRNYYTIFFPTKIRTFALHKRKGDYAAADSVWPSIALAQDVNGAFNWLVNNQPDSAVAYFRAVKANGPGDYALPDAFTADTYMQMKKPDLALTFADSALAIDSSCVAAWQVRVWACQQKGDSTGAKESQRHVKRLCPWLTG